MRLYKLSEEQKHGAECYGVELCEDDEIVDSVSDVFVCKAHALEIVALLNTLEVEPCHFRDVIEDYLTDFSPL